MGGNQAGRATLSERTYFEPADVTEVIALLAKHPQTRIVAGGSDLVVGARSGKSPLPAALIAVHRVTDLDFIEKSDEGGLRVGALVTHAALETSARVLDSYTAVSDAAALVGSPATRHVGTIGGNICNASPAMELGSPLLIFDTAVELSSLAGVRKVPFDKFVTGPGRTASRAGELLTAAVLAPLPAGGKVGSAYVRLEYRQAMEIAIVGAAALVVVDAKGVCTEARISLTAVAPTCVRVPTAERILAGQVVDAEVLERAASSAVDVAKPIDDVRGSASYRLAMVPVIVNRALTIAWTRATSQEAR
jgi:CO/xanthine dehydrogenase FAD-binding subunit